MSKIKFNKSVVHSVLDSNLRMYADTNRYVAYELKKRNNVEIIQIGCKGNLNCCTSKNSMGSVASIDQLRNACRKCTSNQSTIYSDKKIFIDLYEINNSKKLFLEGLSDKLHSDKNLARIIDLKYKNIEFCRIAFFDWSILFKLGINSCLNSSQINKFIQGVEDLLKIHEAIQENELASKKVSQLFYVNGNYSQNTLLRLIMANDYIEAISIEPQPFSNQLLNKICFKKDRVPLDCYGLINLRFDNRFINLTSLRNILATFKNRFYGKEYNAYTSTKKNSEIESEIIKIKNFTKKYKLICSYFAHSSDEVIPHEITHNANEKKFSNEIKNQDEFFGWIIEVAKVNPELGFIIRLHPRMASNKRDGFESEEHTRVKKILGSQELPNNLFLIKGNSKISSYYVIYKSTLVVVGWSTIGLEALALGKPVISIFPNLGMYPIADITTQPKSIMNLKDLIKESQGYGTPKGERLAIWLSNAYDFQYQKIPVLRTIDGPLSIIMHIFINVLIRLNLTSLWFKFYDAFIGSGLNWSYDFVPISGGTNLALCDEKIYEYFSSHRKRWEVIMEKYEK